MARDNFYRRDPGLALQGMASMPLEERGVYNTVIDLLYLTWRPIEDNRRYIAAHCNCAVQKLNPLVNRLLEAGKLIRFEEGGRAYISNQKFEDERASVKGETGTRSGRKVEEKSAGVEEKSASVSQNPPLRDTENEEKQPVTPLERVEKSREEPPQVPQGDAQPKLILIPDEPEPPDEAAQAFELWNRTARRCGLPLAKDLTPARRRTIRKRLEAAGLEGWRDALHAVEVSRFLRGKAPGRDGRTFKADLDFVCQAKSFSRLRELFYGEDVQPPDDPDTPPQTPNPWRGRLMDWDKNRYWNDIDWGPRPGRDGCLVPPDLLPAPADVLLFPERVVG